MPIGTEKNEVFGDYAAFLNALLPQAAGFLFHDRHGRLFWHDNSPDTSQLSDAYHESLKKALTSANLPEQEGRIPLRDCTAYLVKITSDKGKVLGVLTALASQEMGGMPYQFCHDLLQPAVRSLSRELSLRMHLLDATSKLSHQGGEHDFLKMLGEKARASGRCEESLAGILELAIKHLLLDGAVFLAPQWGLSIVAGDNPVDLTEAELLLESMQDLVAEDPANAAEALNNRPPPDPRERSRAWPVLDDGSRLAGVVVLSRAVDAGKLSEHSASLASFVVSTIEHVLERGFDSLTGLINWPGFEGALRDACRDNTDKNTLMFMNIDQLHVINDTFGQDTGDEVLRSFGQILRDLLPGSAVTRVTSDCFAALLTDVALEDAERLGTEICAALKNLNYASGDQQLRPSVSIGVAPLSPTDANIRSALVPAQIACQAAKDRGRGRCEVYQSTDESIVRRMDELSLVGSIRSAIEGGRLVLHAQPIVRINAPEKLDHYEILVRMIDADGNSLEPAEFLGAAERFQLMQELDRWVVSKAIETLDEKRTDADGQPLHFAINLSGQSLGNEQFLEFVRDELARSSVQPERLCFEITETVAVGNLQKAQVFISELKSLGCRFALDDFGTGLSSFAYLKLFAVDKLKVDGSFVRDIVENEVSRSMVAAITEIARVMDIEVVAEYVQTQDIMDVLGEIGVKWAQGFHVGEPVRLKELFGEGTITDMADLVDIDASLIVDLESES